MATIPLARCIAAACVCLMAGASSLFGAVITYAPPIITRPDVSYVAVSESSTSDAVPLYGAPLNEPTANRLAFNNMGFSSVSSFGTPVGDFTDGQINLTVDANAGKSLTIFKWTESGDYNISNFFGAGTNSVFISPQALQIKVLEINNVPVLLSDSSQFLNYSGTVFSNSAGGFSPVTGNWSATKTVDLVSLFGSSEITKISVSFDNQLIAVSGPGGVAQISKKFVEFAPTVTDLVPVPEPASLAAIGVGTLFLIRRRRMTTPMN